MGCHATHMRAELKKAGRRKDGERVRVGPFWTRWMHRGDVECMGSRRTGKRVWLHVAWSERERERAMM